MGGGGQGSSSASNWGANVGQGVGVDAANSGLFGLNQAQWSGIGKGVGQGFQAYGQGVAAGGRSSPQQDSVPQFSQTPIENASPPFALIPKTGATGNEILEALQRLGAL